MKQVETSSGFELEINENCADDMEFLDLVCQIQAGNVLAYDKLLNKLMSAEDRARLYEHVRTEDGRSPISAIDVEVAEIISKSGQKK